ncbi:CREB-regulated transcription coactivator 2-like isoform X2 [Stegostoma tigrinum]|uniref:CREB-regulated transcription coactivator 2-like isoform X2 n=1 Tax=Stegostoma tigrinum TaxID=3053191 RepID=UPI0028706FBB|nr:CREB-regulated transcription coactivator 2-like isoform X2 [Stegostoma tigrinum]
MAGGSNPRKFSEKIALHNQKQAEETAAFEEVMMELNNSRLQAQKVRQLRLSHTRGPYYGGSLPNVNAISSNNTEFQSPFSSVLDSSRGTRHHGLVERVQRARLNSPHRRQVDSSPYSSAYLSPPPDTSWRRNAPPWCNFPLEKGHRFGLSSTLNRTNSDSALHTSVNNPNAASPFASPGQAVLSPTKRSGLMDGELDSFGKGFPFSVPPHDNIHDEDTLLPKALWDTRKVQSVTSRPRSCEVPGINKTQPLFSAHPLEGMEEAMTWSSAAQQKDDLWRRATKKGIFPSPDQVSSMSHVSGALNTGGSLPDLTNLHFPPPLPTPLDPEESTFSSISGGSSTGNLTTTMTHLGIGGSLAMASNYESTGGLSSSLQGSLSNMSLQSSLSNPSLQSSLSTQSLSNSSLQSSLSNPSLQSSLSSSSLRTSLSNPSLQSPTGNPPLQPAVNAASKQSPLSTSSLHSSLSSSLPPGSISTSPRRRVPLNPLVLSSGDSRRPHSKQFSPTMSPTLSSITQGIPLDTSNLSMDQRLPPYPFCQQQGYQQSQQPTYQQPPSQPPGYQQSQLSQQQGYQQSQPSQQQGYQQSQPSQQQTYQQSQQSQPSQQQGYQQSQPSQQQGYQQSQPSQQQGYQQSQQSQPSQQQGYQQSQPSQQQGYQQSQPSQQQVYQQSHQSQQQGYQQSQPSQQQGYQQSQPSQQQGYQQSPKTSLSQRQQQATSPCGQTDTNPGSRTSLLKNFFGDSYFEQQLSSQTTGDLSHQLGSCSTDTLVANMPMNMNTLCGNTGSSSFTQAAMVGLVESSESLQDPQLLNKQNMYSSNQMTSIPDIILTGESPPGFSKEITSALAGVPGFEVDSQYPLDDELKVEPLSLDGLSMLSDPNLTLLSDPTVEDSFRNERL